MSKILIVEDDPLLIKLYKSSLKSTGFEFEIVTDGKEGFGKIMSGGYDLILLDIMLPNMDGLSILKEYKKGQPVKPNGPIVVMTNLTGGAIEKEAIGFGADECVDKSLLRPEALVAKVQSYLQK